MTLITEEVKWVEINNSWYLKGACDHVASVGGVGQRRWLLIYEISSLTDHGYKYGGGTLVGHFVSVEEAKEAAPAQLILCGLLDPITWLSCVP